MMTSTAHTAATRTRNIVTFLFLLFIFSLFANLIYGAVWLQVAIVIGLFAGMVLLSRGIFAVACVWILGMPTLFVFSDRYLDAIPAMNTGRLLFLALIAMLVMGRAFGVTEYRKPNRIEWVSAFFLTIALISLIVQLPNENLVGIKHNIAMYLQGYLMPLGAFFIARRIDWNPQRVNQLILCFALAGIFLAIVAVLQQFLGVTIFNPTHIQVINADRAGGTLGSSHEFGAVLTAFIVLSLMQIVRGRRTHGTQFFFLMAAGCMVLALILTKTRGPWLAALAAMLFLFIYDGKARPLFLGIGITGVFAGIVLIPFFVDADLWRYRITDMSPIYNRLTAWATALNAIVHNPFGMGFTELAFDKAKAGYISNAGSISAFWAIKVGIPHNEYLNLALLTGIPGLAVYLWFIRLIYTKLKHISTQGRLGGIASLALYVNAILISFLVNALTIDFAKVNYFTILLFFMVGAAIRSYENATNKASNVPAPSPAPAPTPAQGGLT